MDINTYTATIQANPENFTFQLPYTYIRTPTIKCIVSSEATNNLFVTFKVINPIDGQIRRTMRKAIQTIANMASSNCEPVLEVRDQKNKVYSVVETPGERNEIIISKMERRREYRNMF